MVWVLGSSPSPSPLLGCDMQPHSLTTRRLGVPLVQATPAAAQPEVGVLAHLSPSSGEVVGFHLLLVVLLLPEKPPSPALRSSRPGLCSRKGCSRLSRWELGLAGPGTQLPQRPRHKLFSSLTGDTGEPGPACLRGAGGGGGGEAGPALARCVCLTDSPKVTIVLPENNCQPP